MFVSVAVLMAATAWAGDSSSPWLLGMQLGQAQGDGSVIRNDSVESTDDVSLMSYDMAATVGGPNRFGWRVFTGYRFTDYFAVHLGYTDLGEAQSKLIEDPMAYSRMPTFERVGVEAVRGVDLGVQLKVPVSERVYVDVHGGKYFWRSNTRISGLWTEGLRTDDFRSEDRGTDDFFGAGLEVAVMHDLSATLSWTRYQVGSEPVALWTVGALYRFGFY